MQSWKPVAGALASMVLAGCATVPADRGASVSNELLVSRSSVLGRIPVRADEQQQEVTNLLATPLDADAAVRFALARSPRMRTLYAELGLAQAEVYDATRLSNPALGYMRKGGDGGGTTTWSISQRFTELLFIGYRSRLSRSELLQSQQRVASEVLTLEADVRSAYYNYVGAELVKQLRDRAAQLAGASAQYADELFKAGNINALQLSREQAQASAARIDQRSADIATRAAQSRLLTLLGLPLSTETTAATPSFVTTLSLPAQLTAAAADLQGWALKQRLDLAALRERRTLFERNLQHVSRWRWLGGVELEVERETEQGDTAMGYGGSVELPLFNQGGGSLLRARAGRELSDATLAALEINIGNDVVVRHAALGAAYDNVYEYRQRLVPLRERIVELSQQQQSFMLVGAFELIQAKQDELDTYQGYLDAVRDYWVAHSELLHAVGGRLPDTAGAGSSGIAVAVPDVAAGQSDAGGAHEDHSQHATHEQDAAEKPATPSMDHSEHMNHEQMPNEKMNHDMHEGMQHGMPGDTP